MRKILLAVLLLALPVQAWAAGSVGINDGTNADVKLKVNPDGSINAKDASAPAGAGDPCESPAVAKSSAPIDITSATTTEIVAAVAAKKVYVCGWDVTASGTGPIITFKTGTKVTNPCDTTPATLSGAYAALAGGMELQSAGDVITKMTSITAGEICITTAGTPVVHGTLYYVQQ